MTAPEPTDAPPLIVTASDDILDELLRLAAASGVTPEVVSDVGAARQPWTCAPLVLVGADLVSALVATHPIRRDQVLVVSHAVDDALYRHALDLGAETVVRLPDGNERIVDLLTDTLEDHPRGTVAVAVVGGCGGAGATTFAAALSITAVRSGLQTLLVDGDPLGGGLDLTLGSEGVDGCRWPDLVDTSGRVSAPSLRDALPRMQQLAVLSWDRSDVTAIPADVMREVLSAGRRGHDLVVVDLPRRLDAASEQVLAQSDTVLVVVPAEVRAVAAAARITSQLAPHATRLELVVRGPGPAGLNGRLVAETLELPLAAEMRAERGLTEALDLGRGPWQRQRGPLARACRTVLDRRGLSQTVAA